MHLSWRGGWGAGNPARAVLVSRARERVVLPAGRPWRVLGPRERELFVLIGRGLRSKEIADAVGLTKASVDTYRKRIATKLCRSGADLVRLAALHGQLPLAA
jgi:DNA-binding NarL/FixJ family response regulator